MDSAFDFFQPLVRWDRSTQLANYMVLFPKEHPSGIALFIDVRNYMYYVRSLIALVQ